MNIKTNKLTKVSKIPLLVKIIRKCNKKFYILTMYEFIFVLDKPCVGKNWKYYKSLALNITRFNNKYTIFFLIS